VLVICLNRKIWRRPYIGSKANKSFSPILDFGNIKAFRLSCVLIKHSFNWYFVDDKTAVFFFQPIAYRLFLCCRCWCLLVQWQKSEMPMTHNMSEQSHEMSFSTLIMSQHKTRCSSHWRHWILPVVQTAQLSMASGVLGFQPFFMATLNSQSPP